MRNARNATFFLGSGEFAPVAFALGTEPQSCCRRDPNENPPPPAVDHRRLDLADPFQLRGIGC
uniref:Uncharacterized protein n=1 Tax=Leersia perrieri TaxID=77586 RepID=A0A0D9XY87_9ORYZ